MLFIFLNCLPIIAISLVQFKFINLIIQITKIIKEYLISLYFPLTMIIIIKYFVINFFPKDLDVF